MMRASVASLAAMLSFSGAAGAVQQAAPAPAPAPAETPIPAAERRMVEALIAAINLNRVSALEAWLREHVAVQPTKPAMVWIDSFGGIARSTGGLTLTAIERVNAGQLRVVVRTGIGQRRREFACSPARSIRGKRSISLMPSGRRLMLARR